MKLRSIKVIWMSTWKSTYCQFEPLPRAKVQPQGHGGPETSSSEESEGEEHVNEDRIGNTNW